MNSHPTASTEKHPMNAPSFFLAARGASTLRALLFAAMCPLVACAHPTEAKYRALLDPWMGERIDELVESWGYPTSSFVAPSGRMVYVYVYATSYMTPTYTSSSAGIQRSVFGGYELSGSSITTGGQVVTHYCRTYFEVAGTRKQIVKISFEGDSCRV
jgi:hypothetical protein